MESRPIDGQKKIATPTAVRGGVFLWLLLFALAVTSQFTDLHSWPSNHEGLRVPCLIDHFVDEWSHGRLYPRFLPNANGGYGYPTFVFYPPAFFAWAAPVAWATGSPIVGAYVVVVVAFFLAGLGAYTLSRLLRANVFSSLIVATLYMATPYFFVDLYVRCDLAELLAILSLPWPVNLILCSDVTRALFLRRSLLAISVAFIVLSHPLIGMPFIPFVSCVVLFGTEQSRSRKLANLVAILAGVAIASPYWLPAVLLQDRIMIQRAFEGVFSANNHFVSGWQFISPKWGFGGSHKGMNDALSFQLGLPHLVLCVLGGILNCRRSGLVRIIVVLYGILLFMMLEQSSVAWDMIAPLKKLQYPWRLLGLTSLCQLILMASLGRVLSRQTAVMQLALGVWLPVISAIWYWPMFHAAPEKYFQADEDVYNHRQQWNMFFYTYACVNEFTPLTASQIFGSGPLRDRPIIEAAAGCRVVFPPASNRSFVVAEIHCDQPTTVVLNQLYFPGWTVKVDDVSVPDKLLTRTLSDDGRMQIDIPCAGTHRIQAAYSAPPGEALGLFVGAGLAIGLLIGDLRLILRARNANGQTA